MYELKLCKETDLFDRNFKNILQNIKFYDIPEYFTRNQIIFYKYGAYTFSKILNDEILEFIQSNNIDYYLKFEIVEYKKTSSTEMEKFNLSIFLPDEETALYFKLKYF